MSDGNVRNVLSTICVDCRVLISYIILTLFILPWILLPIYSTT